MSEKTCSTCQCNKVCDHNKYGFENCGNYISGDLTPRAEERWEKNLGMLKGGALGDDTSPETLLRYWKAQEEAGYPYASENVKYFENMVRKKARTNMEKEQIVKALECCTRGRKSKDDRPCFECPYNECNLVGGTGERQTSGTCQGWLMKDALSIIREQEKRIEKLENICNSYALQYGTATDKEVFLKKERADTARKMQKMLKEKAMDVDMDDATLWLSCVPVDDIDQIAKQLTEDKA